MNMRTTLVVITAIAMISGCSSLLFNKDDAPQAKLVYSKNLAVGSEKFWQDKKLEKAFSAYWGLKYAKKPEQLFKMEAQYFQEMASSESYRMMSAAIKDTLVEIELRNQIVHSNQRLVRIPCTVYLTGEKGNRKVPITDEWLYMGEKWYHVLKDPLLFPNES